MRYKEIEYCTGVRRRNAVFGGAVDREAELLDAVEVEFRQTAQVAFGVHCELLQCARAADADEHTARVRLLRCASSRSSH